MENLLPYEKVNRKVIVKIDSETDYSYGKKPEERTVEELIKYGVVNINKPQGPTSHQVSGYVKQILHINKCGHSGSLDPNVTGVLPVALDKATRIVYALLKTGKEYVCLMHLHKEVDEELIKKSAKDFIGKIHQLVPKRSAVKRQVRQREIYYLSIIEIDGKEVLFRIGCEAGFYVRKFCHDWAIKLGTRGNMKQLVRTKVSMFTDKNWHSLQDLKDAYENYKENGNEEIRKVIIPFEYSINFLPKMWVLDTTVDTLCHGAHLSVPGISKYTNDFKNGDLVAIYSLKNELICLGNALVDNEYILDNEKGNVIKNDMVFMERNTYPKYIKEKAL